MAAQYSFFFKKSFCRELSGTKFLLGPKKVGDEISGTNSPHSKCAIALAEE